jgi:hypothetical protein
MLRKLVITGVALLTVAVAGGCIFNPREPERPEGDEGCKWIVPTFPKNVFVNLKCGFEGTSNDAYEKSLSLNYTLLPRDEDKNLVNSQAGYDVYQGWDKERELNVVTRVKAEWPQMRFVRYGYPDGSFDREDPSTDPAEYQGPYMLVLDAGGGVEPDTLAGVAIWKIENSTQGWVILEWEDIDIVGTYPTLGYWWGLLSSGN